MKRQIRNSAILLLGLGILFCIPVAAKTWSAHGALAALATALLVVFSVCAGPLSFGLAELIDASFITTNMVLTRHESIAVTVVGAGLLLTWLWRLRREGSYPVPYLPVTGWALMGAYFCVSVVFSHTT